MEKKEGMEREKRKRREHSGEFVMSRGDGHAGSWLSNLSRKQRKPRVELGQDTTEAPHVDA